MRIHKNCCLPFQRIIIPPNPENVDISLIKRKHVRGSGNVVTDSTLSSFRPTFHNILSSSPHLQRTIPTFVLDEATNISILSQYTIHVGTWSTGVWQNHTRKRTQAASMCCHHKLRHQVLRGDHNPCHFAPNQYH